LTSVLNNGKLFTNAITDVNPDIVLLDAIISYNYFFIRERFKVIILQSMVSGFEDETPPLTSTLIPDSSFFYTIRLKFAWQKYYMIRRLVSLAYLGDSQFGVVKRIYRDRVYNFNSLFLKKKTFQYGLANIREIIMSPLSFDFPGRRRQRHQYYAGLCLNDLSSEPYYAEYENFIKTIPIDVKVVYCSLGTLSLIHFNQHQRFYKILINVFKERSEHLIISLGQFDKIKLGVLPDNVHAFNAVHQNAVLSNASLMITHGGLNSVLECIHHEVPMLVLPLNNIWDQNGNAARVVYHGLGLRESILKLTEKRLSAVANSLMNNQIYQANLKQMKLHIDLDKNKVDVVDVIEKIVNEII